MKPKLNFLARNKVSVTTSQTTLVNNVTGVDNRPVDKIWCFSRKNKFPNKIVTTKYKLWSFIFVNFYEQMVNRLANVYFLLIAIFNWIPFVESLNPAVSMMPIISILLVTAIKDGIEDYKRYLSDKKINSQKVAVFSPETGQFISNTWESLTPGDIIQLPINSTIPADCLIISSSEPNQVTYLKTSNLDGEANLKQFQALGLDYSSLEKVDLPPPTPEYTKIYGTLYTKNSDSYSFNSKNCLLRGCTLLNTDCVTCLVLFTGTKTKTQLNQNIPKRKTSKLEHAVNTDLLFIFVLNVTLATLMAIAATVTHKWVLDNYRYTRLWFPLKPNEDTPMKIGGITFITYFIAIQAILPIAIYVSWELVRLAQIVFIHFDRELFYKSPETNKYLQTKCNALNITEDLGQIEYIFSDKTGTLTDNIMEFRKCIINDVKFHENTKYLTSPSSRRGNSGFRRTLSQSAGAYLLSSGIENIAFSSDRKTVERFTFEKDSELVKDFSDHFLFFQCVITCHGMLMSKDSEGHYEGESQDEAALLDFALNYGVKMVDRSETSIKVEYNIGESVSTEEFTIHHAIPFSSSRKRMSVLVESHSTDQVWLFTKGADEIMFDLAKNPTTNTKAAIDAYASDGLRTLVFGAKELDSKEFTLWQAETDVINAELDVEKREKMQAKLDLDLEKDLEILAGTGIEDKLQEKLPQTVAYIRDSGVKLWVITGDKLGTAKNIGYSSKLLCHSF